MHIHTLINVNNIFYFNGEKITHNEYLELLNTTFIKSHFSINDKENVVTIKVKFE